MKPKLLKSIYLCYFGVREPLVQTQVLPYLRYLASNGVQVTLLTFEAEPPTKWPDGGASCQKGLQAEGINWVWKKYHKRPSLPATLWDLLVGTITATQLATSPSTVLHARSHIPVAMAMLTSISRGCPILFDCRGLLADEYVDAGVWRLGSLPYRAIKCLERKAFRESTGIVVLTEKAREWLKGFHNVSGARIHVIPCCVDLSRFEISSGGRSGFEVVYAGSTTGLYLTEEMARFFAILRRKRNDAFLRVLTHGPSERVQASMSAAGVPPDAYAIQRVSAEEVPSFLQRAKLGISFRKATFSQIAASPTKIGEYLAAGVPVVANAGIGDVDHLLESSGVGVVLPGWSDDEMDATAERAVKLAGDSDAALRCRRVAERYFSLIGLAGPRYIQAYEQVLGAHGDAS